MAELFAQQEMKMAIEIYESDSVRNIPGVGPTTQANLLRLNLATIHNVLEWYPRQYLDASQPQEISGLPTGELVIVEGTILTSREIRTKGRAMIVIEALLSDASGELRLRWFNQRFLLQKLAPGTHWICLGHLQQYRGERVMINPILETEPRILPVYSQTAGVTSKQLREYIRFAIERVTFDLIYELPESIRKSENLLSRALALRYLHQPEHMSQVEIAHRTVAYAEAFWFFIQRRQQSNVTASQRAPEIPIDTTYLQELVGDLPFTLTPGQKRSLWEIVQDLAKPQPMTRLLNGDVGSGKTIVAGLAAATVAKNGLQSALLVPTSLLAEQHAQALGKLLAKTDLKVSRWTAKQKEATENADLIVGTHALLQEGVQLPRLGLLIVDEQHRFGVRQRRLLRERRDALLPHLLSMTATPIPRSLALALFSDLQMSVIQDKPTNRLPIETAIIHPLQRKVMQERILAEIGQGHQVFVICPLIEESEDGTLLPREEQKTVLKEVERLRHENPEYGTIEVLHGRMKEAEKQAVMARMAAGEIQVLVATSVIEVGIDISNATVMVIEGAEHFGLSQLHQFRGRVGRSNLPSYCFLCPSLRSPAIDQRLNALVQFDSGFAIAEADLDQRGPGDLAGLAQSGLPEFKAMSLGNIKLLKHIKEVVGSYLTEHPEFLESLPQLSTDLGGLE